MKIYVTGCAGFIGSNVCRMLLAQGHEVTGQDCLTDYYDPAMKRHRLSSIARERFSWQPQDILDHFPIAGHDILIHLAGQPGVRDSLATAPLYVQRNVAVTTKVMDSAMRESVSRVVYASSSSVYGLDSMYSATKASCELIANQYADQFDAVIGCRIFPTYGPMGRPDMAPWKIATSILRGEPVLITGDGTQRRDYTYIENTAAELIRLSLGNTQSGIRDVGRGRLRSVNELLALVQDALGMGADVRYIAKPTTETDNLAASSPCGSCELEDGIPAMVESVRMWEGR